MFRYIKTLIDRIWPNRATNTPTYDNCNQIDIGSGHYTTGIVAAEVNSGTGEARKTYQFWCHNTRSYDWMLARKKTTTKSVCDLCGKPITLLNESDAEILLENKIAS